MSQLSFSEAEYSNKKRTTRRERFLSRMEDLIPWSVLEGKLLPHYPKKGEWSSFLPSWCDAQGSLHAIILQPIRPDDGRLIV